MTLADSSFTTSTARQFTTSTDALNQFFASVFLPRPNTPRIPTPTSTFDSSTEFIPVSIEEILSLLSALSIGKATDADGISARLLKECADVIAPLLNCSTSLWPWVRFLQSGNMQILFQFPKPVKLASSTTTAQYPYYPLCPKSLSMWCTPEPFILSNLYSTLNNMAFDHEDPASPNYLMLYTILARRWIVEKKLT